MIVWVTILGLALSWLGNELLRARRQRQIVETIQRFGGRARYDYDLAEIRGSRQHQKSRGRLLNEIVGPDLFAHVSGIYFGDNTKATDDDLRFLSELPRLEAVELFGAGITDKTIDRLMHARGLRGLHLDDTLCTTAAVSRLPAIPKLEYFTLLGVTANDANMPPLATMTNLESLNLCSFSHNQGKLRAVTDAGLAHIAKLEKLTALYLGGVDITDEGLRHLRGLKNLHGLTLDSPQVTDAGMEHVAALTKLTFLHFHKLNIGDAGVEHLAALPDVEILFLDDSKITDAATVAIAKFPNLQALQIARTAVTDEGLKNLQSAPSLRRLSVASNVTKDGLTALSQALPNCSIRGSDGTTEYNFP